MNSTIIVHQNTDIPAGPLPGKQSVASATTPGSPKGAIIRPAHREAGADGSLRIDPADSPSAKAHIRTYQLEDYVNWLREKIEQDQADQRVAEQTSPSPKADPELISEPVESVQSIGSSDSITVEAPRAEPESANTTPNTATEFHRLDQPHDDLVNAYVKFDELRTKQAEVEAAELNAQPDVAKDHELSRLSAEDTEAFIATISKAIASVLTEVPEAEFEQKVRHHLESELNQRAYLANNPPQPELDVNVEKAALEEKQSMVEVDSMDQTSIEALAEAAGRSNEEMANEAQRVATQILNGSRTEIPTSVAAWDVEDFRWPIVTNRMIVSGGSALDQLTGTIQEMISPANQRLAIAGLGRGEGTTSIAISLARWSAACAKNVLLVDADLVSPSLSSQVGLAPNISWINVVNQALPTAEAIVRSQKSNLCIMPLAPMVSRVTWPRFIYDSLGELLDQVRSHFDLVILDVGPANQLMAELSRSSLLVDATLMVHNGANSSEFQKTKSRLEMFGLDRMIVAENRAVKKSVNVA